MATYNEQKDTNHEKTGQAFQLPKNVRQLGNVQGNIKIYMEDFVYTYLHGNSQEENWEYRGCILLGNTFMDHGQKIILISAAICITDQMFTDGCPEFSDRMWGHVYQNIKQYFDQVEILGWGMDVSGSKLKLTSELEKVHRNAFSNQEKLLFLMDRMEEEEAFYVYEKNMLRRKEGYYIYYQKNPQMREYMLRNHTDEQINPEIDPQQTVMTKYRAKQELIGEKKGKGVRRAVYVASLGLIAFMAAVGVNQVTSSQKMKELEETISYIGNHQQNTEQSEPVEKTGSAITQQTQVESDQPLIKDQEEIDRMTDNSELVRLQEESEEKQKEETPVSKAAVDVTSDEEKTESESSQKKEKKETKQAQAAKTYYTVKKGDSLLSISKQLYGKNRVKELVEKNELENEDKIYEGQKLILLDK